MFGSPADFLVPAVYTAGSYIEQGLPNIIGTFTQIHSRDYMDGAMYIDATKDNITICSIGGSVHAWDKAHIDASRSSSIYGKSDVVQPSALTMRIYIKY